MADSQTPSEVQDQILRRYQSFMTAPANVAFDGSFDAIEGLVENLKEVNFRDTFIYMMTGHDYAGTFFDELDLDNLFNSQNHRPNFIRAHFRYALEMGVIAPSAETDLVLFFAAGMDGNIDGVVQCARRMLVNPEARRHSLLVGLGLAIFRVELMGP